MVVQLMKGAALHSNQNRNLVKAAQKVSRAWFPINKPHYEQIQQGLERGAYDLGIDFLIGDIRKDFSLYMYCLKEVRSRIRERNLKVPSHLPPGKLLEFAGIDLLKEILSASPDAISSHSLEQEHEHELQMQRMQEAMIGASAAEELAQRCKIDPDLGYSTELVRQLGLTLIAWNYPQVYNKVMSDLSAGTDIDRELTRRLGFSPRLLAVAMARQWGLCEELRLALGDSQAGTELHPDRKQLVHQTADKVAKLCEIGEALARANSPETYPTARSDWQTAREEIFNRLGESGLRLIQNRVVANCEYYVKHNPDVFSDISNIQKEPTPHRQGVNIFERNKYIKECPEETRDALIHLYENIQPGGISQKQLSTLIQDIIPQAGFLRGTVFILDPDRTNLLPRVAIGDSEKCRINTRTRIDLIENENSPVVAAFSCNTPMVETQRNSDDQEIISFACVLGSQQRAGVLYLEAVMSESAELRSANSLLCFKALCQALVHCLNLQ